MYFAALSAGLTFGEIDDLTTAEIAVAAHVKNEQQRDFYQAMAWIVYNGAALTGVAINDPKRFPRLEDAFPSLFEHKEQQDWRAIKARVENYAKVKNTNSKTGENIYDKYSS
ncbi:MAG: hypothetical protein FWE14_09375 [Lachnospiraceae bacterium]|nr:hypothetical protein [Lachnospiraceae bacterium]